MNLNNLGSNETALEHTAGSDYFGVSSNERKWRGKLERLAKEHPDEVTCIARNDDGSVYYHVPESYVSIRPPKKMNLSEEQLAERADRLRRVRAEKKAAKDGN